mmetsp:Transcript_4831/g.7327  ORF Transcript_4831/g.7327 Transcript_4831/m.7327 type:complete len:165 (-) Transcript_4831:21-515(-)
MKRWQFDMSGTSSSLNVEKPPGFQSGFTYSQEIETRNSKTQIALKEKRAMQLAMAPGQSLLMNAFMMYMSGSSINIFSIMITGMVLSNCGKNIMNVNRAFSGINDGKVKLVTPKIIYGALNILGVAMAFYKLTNLGLLPVTSADWTSRLPFKTMLEYSGASLKM